MIITELGRGRYSDCFTVTSSAGQAVAMKLSYYQEATIRAFTKLATMGDRDAAHDAKDQDAISVSMAMAEVAKNMRAYGVSPHFVRVYREADIRDLPRRLRPLLGDRLARLTPRQIKYSHVCLMELYACNLTGFLTGPKANDVRARALLFQVLFTLACLHIVFPGFRHNDLSTNNVLVKRARHRCVKYTYRNTTYFVRCPYVAALADFDFTHVPGHAVLSNERVLGGKYGITGDPNPSYDTHLLLKTTLKCLQRRNACPETLAFLRGLRLEAQERLDAHVPHLHPATLLHSPYFAPLRTPEPSCDAAYAMPA